MTFCLWLTEMEAKELMIKEASFSFPCSVKINMMVTNGSLMTYK